MEDRFRFRVFDKTKNKMVYFDGIFGNKRPYTEGSTFLQYESCPCPHVLSETMQCIGLKDKNGKLIYEGDIIKDGSCNWIVIWNIDLESKYVLKRIEVDNVYPHIITFSSILNWKLKDYEIIGNIYENPELLEVRA